MPYTLEQESTFVKKKGQTYYWKWEASIDSDDPEELDKIELVEYQFLSKNITDPVKIKNERENRFYVSEENLNHYFKIRVNVFLKDRTKQQLIYDDFLILEEKQDLINEIVIYSLAYYLFDYLELIHQGRKDKIKNRCNSEKNINYLKENLYLLRNHGYVGYIPVSGISDNPGEGLSESLKLVPAGEDLVKLRVEHKNLKAVNDKSSKRYLQENQQKINEIVIYSVADYIFKYLKEIYDRSRAGTDFLYNENDKRYLIFLRNHGYINIRGDIPISELKPNQNLIGVVELTLAGHYLVELRVEHKKLKDGNDKSGKKYLQENQQKINHIVVYSVTDHIFKYLKEIYDKNEDGIQDLLSMDQRDYEYRNRLYFLRAHGYIHHHDVSIHQLRPNQNLIGVVELTPAGRFLVDVREEFDRRNGT